VWTGKSGVTQVARGLAAASTLRVYVKERDASSESRPEQRLYLQSLSAVFLSPYLEIGHSRFLHILSGLSFIIIISFDVCFLFVCFPGVTTHCGCIFHSPVAGFSLLVFEVS
jgi:hypothetical protein